VKKPEHVIEILLQPGDFHFGGGDTRIRTILGSCVSITMWHPTRLIGGMCHYMLPSRGRSRSGKLDGKYADDAMALFLREITRHETRPAEYVLKVFGGGNMFPHHHKKAGCGDVASRNVTAAHALAAQHGFTIAAQDLGRAGHRQVFFDIWSGHVWVRQIDVSHAA